eukprot:jgi/Undpi1/1612/HiC_scaffold_11.g05002.m1
MARIKHKARAYLEAAIAAQRQPWQGRQQDEEAAAALALRDRLLNDERSLGDLSPHRRQGETEPRVYHRGGQEHLHDHQHHHQHYQHHQQQQQDQALAALPRHARQSLTPLSPHHRQGETEPRGHDEGGQQQHHHQEQYLNQGQHLPSVPSQPATSSPLSSHRLHGEAEPHAHLDDGQQQQQRINQEQQPLPTPTGHARLSQLGALSPRRGQGETEQQGCHEGGQLQQHLHQLQQQGKQQEEHEYQHQEQEQEQQRQLNKEQEEHEGEEKRGEEQEEAYEQPVNTMLEKAVMSATANCLETSEVVRATMTEACIAVIQRQVRYISLPVH